MIHSFHKRVKARIFEISHSVFKCVFQHQDEYKREFLTNWKGSYMVHNVLSGGDSVLSEMNVTAWPKSINSDAVKIYYV